MPYLSYMGVRLTGLKNFCGIVRMLVEKKPMISMSLMTINTLRIGGKHIALQLNK